MYTTNTINGAYFLFELTGVAADGDIIALQPADRDGTPDTVRLLLEQSFSECMSEVSDRSNGLNHIIDGEEGAP